jgi:hypothetical protein
VAARQRTTLGFTVRIGRAVVVAVGGPADKPQILAKERIDVATTFEEGAVYHAGQELPIEKARALIHESESRFVERARAGLVALVGRLGGANIVAAVMVAPVPKPPPALETILKAHPLVHAAEGELYRRVFAEAAAAEGWRPARVPADALAGRAAAALGLTPARLGERLAAMGKASGRPWAVDQKNAALAAWLALATA